MSDLNNLLDVFDKPIEATRNSTSLARYSEAIIRTFLNYGAERAKVRLDLAAYGLDELYDGLRRVCGKVDYKGVVKVHKQDKDIVILRIRKL